MPLFAPGHTMHDELARRALAWTRPAASDERADEAAGAVPALVARLEAALASGRRVDDDEPDLLLLLALAREADGNLEGAHALLRRFGSSAAPSDAVEFERARVARAVACARAADAAARPFEVARLRASELSLARFRSEFVRPARPAVITGLGSDLVHPGGAGEWLACIASKVVPVAERSTHRDAQPARRLMTVGELWSAVGGGGDGGGGDVGGEGGAGEGLYLYDVSIPRSLPGLLEQLRIPRYFAHDHLARTRAPHAWRGAWPSLFVGAAGTASELHVDQASTHFWMVMVSGAKRWTLFHPDDLHLLAPRWRPGVLAPSFPPLRELERSAARRCVLTVRAGEVLFVPAGTPHHVENLTAAVSYAGNFVDEHNAERALADLRTMGLRDGAAAGVAAALAECDIDEDAGTCAALLPHSQLAVPYEEYASGAAACWAAEPPPLACAPLAPPPSCALCLERLEDDGFVILHGALTPASAGALRAALARELEAALAAEASGALAGGESPFARVNTRARRHDLHLPLARDAAHDDDDDASASADAEPAAAAAAARGDDDDVGRRVRRALRAVLRGAYAEVYRALLPPEAPLVELGVITSHPGAERQTIHADVDFCESARRIYTTFVALQDVDPRMGPTLLWPGTHSAYFCEFYKPRMLGPVDGYYEAHAPVQATLRAGDALLLDTRVMHAGGANASEHDERALLHFSFETTAEPDAPVGFTRNLRPALRERPPTLSELAGDVPAGPVG